MASVVFTSRSTSRSACAATASSTPTAITSTTTRTPRSSARSPRKCYLPANRMLLETIREHEGRFRIAYSITGVALEQFEQYAPGGDRHASRS